MEPTIITAIISALAIIGAAFITARVKDKSHADTIHTIQKHLSPILSPLELGIKIVTPEEYDEVDKAFTINGTYENLPDDYQIWVSAFKVVTDDKGNKTKYYWPQEQATTNKGNWHVKVYNIGDAPREQEQEEFLVLAVGKEGQALIKYFKDAGRENQKWPPIKIPTSDFVECAKGIVKVKAQVD